MNRMLLSPAVATLSHGGLRTLHAVRLPRDPKAKPPSFLLGWVECWGLIYVYCFQAWEGVWDVETSTEPLLSAELGQSEQNGRPDGVATVGDLEDDTNRATIADLLRLALPETHILVIAFFFGMLAAIGQAFIPYYMGTTSQRFASPLKRVHGATCNLAARGDACMHVVLVSCGVAGEGIALHMQVCAAICKLATSWTKPEFSGKYWYGWTPYYKKLLFSV
jgi:hypothetical protein